MAASGIPDTLEMRELKYGGRSDVEKDRVAEALLEEGRRSEALLLFEGRPEHPQLAKEKRWALEEGASFHLLSVRRLGVPVTDEDIRVCALAAERKGRYLDARQCWAALGEDGEIERIAEHLPAGLRPEAPVEPQAETETEAEEGTEEPTA